LVAGLSGLRDGKKNQNEGFKEASGLSAQGGREPSGRKTNKNGKHV
jgi:hypothetical protein